MAIQFQNIKKIALFLGYALFAGWSAYFTTSSIVHKWFSPDLFWLVYVMVFILALLAGYFLTVAIKQIKNHVDPSKGKFFGAAILFLIFWGFSFATNVHYFVVKQHGYDNLSRQVASCKMYLEEQSNKSENIAMRDKQTVQAQVTKYFTEFENSLEDARNNHDGLGNQCISQLKAIENYLNQSNGNYRDKNAYKIWDPEHHQGFTKQMGYNDYGKVRQLFTERVSDALKRKYEAIDLYYKSVYPTQSKEALALANKIEKQYLPQLEDSPSFDDLYKCYRSDITKLIAKMPPEYEATSALNKVYSSKHFFDFMKVWGDKMSGDLPEYISFTGAVLMSLLFDLTGFILIALI